MYRDFLWKIIYVQPLNIKGCELTFHTTSTISGILNEDTIMSIVLMF